jgi:signal transduction histidine kinase/CheY-like chemotaxis protein
MDQVWRQAPMPAVRVRDGVEGSTWEANDAALQWFRDASIPAPEIERCIAGLCEPGDADRLLGPDALLRVRCRVVALAHGRLIWFVPGVAPRTEAGDRELIERALYMSDVSVWWIDKDLTRMHFIRRGAAALGAAGDAFSVPLQDHRAQIHPDDRAAVARAAELALREDRVADAMVRYALPGGGYRTLLTRRVARRDAAGRLLGLLGISIDLSELAAERDRSMRLSERMRLAADTIGLGFWSRDSADAGAHWDDQMFRLHHRAPEEGAPTIEEWLQRHVHVLDRDWMGQRQQRAMTEWPAIDDLLFRIPVPGNEDVRWIHARTRRLLREGRRISFGVHVDVTQQQLARLALEAERERIGFVLAAAGVGVWERGLDGRASYLSDVGYHLRGREPSPMAVEDVVADAADPADRAEGEAALRRHVERGETFRHEFRVRWPNGEQRWLASFGRAVRDAAGRPLYVAGVDIDVTERKIAEAEAREHLRGEQESRAKTEFLARMSHELRTPLNAVLGFAALLAHDRDEPLSPRQRERLDRIETAGRRLLLMIDEVLELAGEDEATMPLVYELVDLQQIAAECQQRNEPGAQQAGVVLRLNGDLPAVRLRSDRQRLSRVLDQLVDNAIRFNWPGGLVELRAWSEPRGGEEGWILALRDNGRGMSPEQLSTAFEPFQRLGAEHEGIDGPGIGLAIVRRYVQRLGGRIEADSRPGRGSEFRVWLPQSAEPAGSTAPAPLAGAPAPALRVLCVEDNPVNLLLLREVFGMRPALAVELCEDGASAIARAAEFAPDVLLLDLQLPDFTGTEVMRRLRADERHRHCRYIALSANAMPDDVQAARAAGFDDYWTKPIDVRRFLAAIDALMQPATA